MGGDFETTELLDELVELGWVRVQRVGLDLAPDTERAGLLDLLLRPDRMGTGNDGEKKRIQMR